MQFYILKVRGQFVAVDTYDNCRTIIQERWGWVPMAVADTVLKIEMEVTGRMAYA